MSSEIVHIDPTSFACKRKKHTARRVSANTGRSGTTLGFFYMHVARHGTL